MDRAFLAAFVDRLDDVLPQTQCRRCGHDGCRPYAEAIAAGEAINRCAPGGESVIVELARLTGRTPLPVDPDVGAPHLGERAIIDEARCIGCTLCIAACPVDAIVGGPKRMHGVLAALCSGCALCVPPCPVDCIAMVPAGRAWSRADADAARERHVWHARRKRKPPPARSATSRVAEVASSEASDLTNATSAARSLAPDERRAAVAAALARARARRPARPGKP